MLVLSQDVEDEVVLVLEDMREIVVTLCAVRGDRARLGYTADRSIQVHRRKVWQDIKRRGYVAPKSSIVPPAALARCREAGL